MKAFTLDWLSTAVVALLILAPIAFIVSFIAAVARKVMKKKIKPFVISGIASAVVFAAAAVPAYQTYYELVDVCGGIPHRMPDMRGLEYTACEKNYAPILSLSIEDSEFSFEYPEGTIISTYPAAGTMYYDCTEVKCIVSKGVRMVTIPNVCGIDLETAQMILAYDGFDVVIEYEYSDEISEGYVISTNPEKFEKAPAGSAVTVVVSKGSSENTKDKSIQN